MRKKYYLGVDQGTTGTTALIFGQEWDICGKGYTEHTQYYPKPGWVDKRLNVVVLIIHI